MLDRVDETIVAVSSAPGAGALGIVRFSGPDAVAIADQMTRTCSGGLLASISGSKRIDGVVSIDQQTAVPATFYLFRAPRSYTRQDMVEIHTIGSPVVLDLVRRRAVEFGATPALPGEFTARAFLTGAMDLSSAEAVAGVIRAQTDTQLRASRRMMDGTLTRRLGVLRDEVAQLVGLVEADIDFSEEPIEFIKPDVLCERLRAAVRSLRGLLDESTSADRFDVLPQILLFGAPNAGKSSLMNCLSGTDRAICAAAAGTTRDILSAPIRIGRGEALLLDAAGVATGGTGAADLDRTSKIVEVDYASRERFGGMDSIRSDDQVNAEAFARAVSAAESVDLVCLVVDLTAPSGDSLVSTARSLDRGDIVVAVNKSDLVSPEEASRVASKLITSGFQRVCVVSARTGSGIEELRTAFAESLGSTVSTSAGESVLITDRQRAAVGSAVDAIDRALALGRDVMETVDCADLLAFELREVLDALGAVTGDVTTEELLNQIFADFCIGK